ncbi:small RNA-binding protein 11, chloroplastic-like [Juglans regia]|uniref:Small RNA-binding protein 11, chloroplastic-like n=2 Tax=Juglans regia TaxID=51240 RepID=A0A2I4FHX1_JUGRE|nr:small RNA-binding protein 11, chloroplastic-like [Juglans regia]
MAALRGISQAGNISPARMNFFRGFASRLFVKGISFSTTEDTLVEAFSKFGQVIEAKVIMDKVRNRTKGFGYVTFANEDEAQKALMDMNGKVLDGRVLFVDNVRPSRKFNSGVPITRGPPVPAADS